MNTAKMVMVIGAMVCFLGVSSAVSAEDELEKKMMEATGKAVVAMIWGTKEEARAECEAARQLLLPVAAPKYLSAYVEACYGLTASKFGPQKKPESCPYFQRAVDIWRENPPPADNDEVALRHAGKLKEWKDFVSENCPSTDVATSPPSDAVGKLPVAVPEGATVETLENISYVMPGGWTLEGYVATGGNAYFKNNALDYNLSVQREAGDATGDYPETEVLHSGRNLDWKYTSFVEGGKYYMFFARVKFADAQVHIGITSSGSSEGGVDKATALGIARKLAETIKVLGPRRCIGECGPGKIIPAS